MWTIAEWKAIQRTKFSVISSILSECLSMGNSSECRIPHSFIHSGPFKHLFSRILFIQSQRKSDNTGGQKKEQTLYNADKIGHKLEYQLIKYEGGSLKRCTIAMLPPPPPLSTIIHPCTHICLSANVLLPLCRLYSTQFLLTLPFLCAGWVCRKHLIVTHSYNLFHGLNLSG